ncbi:MAG: serine/threonine protein kinase [Phycisphaerae bacterium]|nr:serine/threonine protein kinase [Phycisphaerae bacterium]
MSSDRTEQIERLFHAAIDREPCERKAFLTSACGGDTALQEEVESLLEAGEHTKDFMEQPVISNPPSPIPDVESPDGDVRIDGDESMNGTRIGPWRLTKRIAVGGMGDVFLADRADGHYEKQAAIKLIRRGIDADPALRRHIIRRFRDERQHLANLDHPNIAGLIDGGTTDDGLPYLVMEYIQGRPITEYCDEHGLGVRERLELLRTVCLAVHHAHSKFVAHRDLKPSNILVASDDVEPAGAGRPVAKLLDFGIAKLLKSDGERTSGGGSKPSAGTHPGLRPMTPEYASPEQVSGREVTAATDVYSLGVILYELVTGELPYRVSQYDAKTVICEQKPPKPSSVKRSVSRELDAIVLKALEKEPSRRYPSAATMAEDIGRYLDGRPIMARPPTFTYLLSRFFVRHGSRVASVVFLLFAIAATTALLATWSRQSQFQANRTAALNRANRFYASAGSLEGEGQYATAEMLLREAIEIERATPPDNQQVHAAKLTLLGRVLIKQRHLNEAERVLRESLDIWNALPPKGYARMAEAQSLLGRCFIGQHRYKEAEPLLTKSYPVLVAQFGRHGKQACGVLEDLVVLYEALGESAKADQYRASLVEVESESSHAESESIQPPPDGQRNGDGAQP